MSTNIALNDQLVADAAVFAARTGRTVVQVIEDAVREKLTGSSANSDSARLPKFGVGGVLPGVDLGSNASMFDAMDSGDAKKFGSGS